MEIALELLTLIISLAALGKTSAIVVDKATKLSAFFGISALAVGLVLISLSTSLPELSVSVLSSASGDGALSAGNVFGSNIANILLILGLGAAIYGFRIPKAEMREIAIILVLTTLISAYIIYASSVSRTALAFPEGLVLLGLFIAYMRHTLMRRRADDGEGRAQKVSKREALAAFLWFFGAVLGVLISAGFVVESALKVAQAAGLAQSFIGATLVAMGTSLPELSVDLQAIRKRQYGMALGDAIGSNMVNLTLVLGTAAVINPVSVALPVLIIALLFAIVANVLLLYLASADGRVGREGGIMFLVAYGAYMAIIFFAQAGAIGG